MKNYIGELARYLMESFDQHHSIELEMDLTAVELDVSQAIPIGLIMNEAVTNSIKYAFPEERKGKIVIALQQIENARWLLRIADNGIGLPPNFDLQKSASIGITLMQTLCEQIGGTLLLNNKNGLEIAVCFLKEIPSKKRFEPII